jgi:hypothetical protein
MAGGPGRGRTIARSAPVGRARRWYPDFSVRGHAVIARHRLSRYDAQEAVRTGRAGLPDDVVLRTTPAGRRWGYWAMRGCPDDRIRDEIADRLADDRSVDASDVSVHVHQGRVTLTGSVMNRAQKRRAEEVADRISGVKDVTNSIDVTSPEEHGPIARADQPRMG